MAEEKTKTEEVIPMIDTANKEILDFSKKEDAEADRIFYEANGLQADGVTPLDEEPKAPPEKPEDGKPPEAKEKTEEKPEDGKPPEKGIPSKEAKEEKSEPKNDDDFTKDLTVENATKRISAAQNAMHTSNKTAKDAVEEQNKLQKENDDLRKIIDENTTKSPEKPEDGKPPEVKEKTEDEVETDLEKLRVEYPEIAEPMIKMMQKQKAENQILIDRIDKQDERETKREADVKVTKETKHYNDISEVHKDFYEITQEPLLDEWIESLPAIEKAGATAIRKGGSTEDVISLLTIFKKANGYTAPTEEVKKTPTDKDSKLDKAKKAVTPQFNKSKDINTQDKQTLFTQEQIKNWSEKEWKENESAVDAAMKQGLVR
jgi:regulator of replication initiation timing